MRVQMLDGQWKVMRVCAAALGFKASAIQLDEKDLRELSRMDDTTLAAHVRQLSARVNRVRYPGGSD